MVTPGEIGNADNPDFPHCTIGWNCKISRPRNGWGAVARVLPCADALPSIKRGMGKMADCRNFGRRTARSDARGKADRPGGAGRAATREPDSCARTK